jgi:hypothetical protein
MADERRQHPRIPMRVAAEVRFTSWHVYSLIYTVNISQGGMLIELPSAAKTGDVLRIRLQPPKGPAVELDADVRHCTANKSGFTVGVQFKDLDSAKKQAIEASIRAHGGTLTTTLKPK